MSTQKRFSRSARPRRLTGIGPGSINPTLTLPLTRSVDAGRCRVSVGVDSLISKPDAVLVEPSQRLLKEPRFRVARRHGSLDDIEFILVQVDPGEGPRFIGVVGELHLMSFDEVAKIPRVKRHPGVPLHEFP